MVLCMVSVNPKTLSGDNTGVTYFHFPSVPELHSPQTDNAYLHYVGHFILLTKLRNSSARRVLTIDLSLSIQSPTCFHDQYLHSYVQHPDHFEEYRSIGCLLYHGERMVLNSFAKSIVSAQ